MFLIQCKVRALALSSLALAGLGAPASAHTTLDAPNGGEVLTPGQVASIEWHVAIAHNLLNWDLWYSTTGDSGPWIPIAMDLPAGSPVAGDPHFYVWTVPNTPSTEVRVRVRMDNSGNDYYDISDGNLTIQSACAPATSYCVTSPNSNGAGALMSHSGSTSVLADDFVLNVTGAASNEFGLFFFGAGQVQTPFGDGILCVASGGLGIFRLNQPQQTNAAGYAQRPVSLSGLPAGPGSVQIQPGDVLNFQFWYRDGAGPSGFNLSDGLSVPFCN